MKFKMLITIALLLAVHQCKSWNTETSNDAHISTRNGSDALSPGVVDYYNGCEDVLEYFPDATFQFGRTLKTSIKTHVDYLGVLTTYNSTIISKGSKNTLKAIGMLSKFGKSREHILTEWRLAAPRLSSAYRDIIWTLSPFIGELVRPINDAISNLEETTLQVLFQYQNRFEERKQERCEKISIEEMIQSFQILGNRIALITDVALKDCVSCNKVFDSLKIAGLIANHYLIAVQGSGNSIASELISELGNVSQSHLKCFRAMDPLLKTLAYSSTSKTNDLDSTKKWLVALAEETKTFNVAIEETLGPFKDPGLTVTQIRQSFTKLPRN